jgi:hypothetical protein
MNGCLGLSQPEDLYSRVAKSCAECFSVYDVRTIVSGLSGYCDFDYNFLTKTITISRYAFLFAHEGFLPVAARWFCHELPSARLDERLHIPPGRGIFCKFRNERDGKKRSRFLAVCMLALRSWIKERHRAAPLCCYFPR